MDLRAVFVNKRIDKKETSGKEDDFTVSPPVIVILKHSLNKGGKEQECSSGMTQS